MLAEQLKALVPCKSFSHGYSIVCIQYYCANFGAGDKQYPIEAAISWEVSAAKVQASFAIIIGYNDDHLTIVHVYSGLFMLMLKLRRPVIYIHVQSLQVYLPFNHTKSSCSPSI